MWILLDQELLRDPYDSALLTAMAVLGLREDGGWLPPDAYSIHIAAVIKVARMVTIRQSILEFEDRDEQPPTLLETVRSKVLKFLIKTHPPQNQPCPISFLFELRSYAGVIISSTPSIGYLTFDGFDITFRDISFSLPRFTDASYFG